jgi:hypothetical protein
LEESLVHELQASLTALAIRDGKPDPALIQALEDKLPVRRAAAAAALAQAGGPAQQLAVRKLLRDPDPTVRLRVALALAIARDKDAVPVLINSLVDLPPEAGWPAQEALFLLAGDKAPNGTSGNDPTSQQKCRDAWAAWWREQGATTNLAKLSSSQNFLGYTLLVQVQGNGAGRVIELGRDGKPRWQIDGLQYPVDAYMLSDNRVLIAEYNGQRVTERDLKGAILWQKQGLRSPPTNAQRLPNGNTFIATMTDVLEVDRTGKEVFSRNPGGQGLVAANKSRTGEIICLTNLGTCLRLDATGKEIKSFSSGRDGSWTSGIDVLPNGRVLISQPNRNLVSEVDAEGKTVWQASVPGIVTATRVPNGHTLVASYGTMKVVELDRAGKVVWEYKDNYHPFRARRR